MLLLLLLFLHFSWISHYCCVCWGGIGGIIYGKYTCCSIILLNVIYFFGYDFSGNVKLWERVFRTNESLSKWLRWINERNVNTCWLQRCFWLRVRLILTDLWHFGWHFNKKLKQRYLQIFASVWNIFQSIFDAMWVRRNFKDFDQTNF